VLSETRYARLGDAHIAYRTLGDGPIDLVFSLGYLSHVEHLFADPRLRNFFDRLAAFSRLIIFDRRGVGLSDPFERMPTLTEEADDLRAVLDDLGSERAAIFGYTTGAPYAVVFAATDPDRVSHLILCAGLARITWAEDYTWAMTPELRTAVLDHQVFDQWGTGALAANFAPSVADDPDFRAWFGALERMSSGPGAARKYSEMITDLDVRSILPLVHQPTLVMHPAASPQIDVRHSLYLAEHIPNATYLELPGADLIPVTPESSETVGAATEEFVTGHKPTTTHNRALRTVLFTDIVDSTQKAAELGDSNWHDVLDRHDALVRRELSRFEGREVKTTGDGFFAAFEGPEKAVRCALSIADAVESAGVEIRSGVHTGECEIRGDDLGGMAVHIGARVASKAKRHEVLVSQTVRDLVVGSELSFASKGEHELKGVPGTWQLYAAAA
jgi:class 3 adenylate cyclase